MSRQEKDALLALFNSFRPSRRVTSFEQLSDGKVLMEVLHQIDATHFKSGPKPRPGSMSGAVNDNWVLKMNTLAPTLEVTSLHEPNFNAIARNPRSAEGSAGLLQISRFCVAVGAMGPSNERVIAKIQALDEGSMVELMKTIEGVMATLPAPVEDPSKADEISPPFTAVRNERDKLISENEELRARCDQLTEQVSSLAKQMDAAKQEQEAEHRASVDSATARATAAAQSAGEAELLRADLQRAEDGLAQTEAELEKQTAIIAELTRNCEELKATASEVSRLREQVEESKQVEERLHRSENVIEKYKKKLEDSAGVRKELRQLEQENAALIDKNSALEVDLRKLSASRAMVDNYRAQVEALEKRVNEQAEEFAHLTVQLEEAQTSERIKELEYAPARRESAISNEGDMSLKVELEADDVIEALSKPQLRLRIRELERKLANAKGSGDDSDRVTTLEGLLADASKARERYQADYLEANRNMLLAQAKLEHILSGKAGDAKQTASAMQQKLDDMAEEREKLYRDTQAAEDAHADLVRQLTAAKADLALVDKDKRSIISSARDEAKTETAKFSEQVNNLQEEIALLRERDRLHLEEIRRLMVDKIELQSAGFERRLSEARSSLGGTLSPKSAERDGLQRRNDELLTEVAKLTDKLKKARAFIKNQDALFRADHDKRLESGTQETAKSYETQIQQLRNELSVAKVGLLRFEVANRSQHNALSLDSRYRLEQQLMLSAWHDLGARVVRDHVGAAGLRRPVPPHSTSSTLKLAHIEFGYESLLEPPSQRLGRLQRHPFLSGDLPPKLELGQPGTAGRRDKDGHVGLLPDVFQVRQKSRNAHLHEIEHTEVDSLHPTSLAMVLYELFCIASHNPQTPQNLRGLIQNIARKVHLQGGVVREVKGLGIGLTLPERMKRNQQAHDVGE
ncbi:protein-nucleus import-related protein [Trichosporon asahii var. asahii CBS 2479]|uniref:Protein-nucleus import-related protein n=1 Tax=Trichosporon asahii var. asahii (strain ATCC 90039 / CBS 2479 / JCM 2466 / KCTC 7840 / NBRC 103889/ NCYC 2677 / UAMH 7654) TaxID=1186058 RepID=J5QDX0_TRIAS|nr:protein-nucleus import-related protein [Trichosporon asahii var. asahii CBS 2479]EJT46863.1 protein-nucleus import-related protein [Trichosporon asahii var. asahii CBS 2479]